MLQLLRITAVNWLQKLYVSFKMKSVRRIEELIRTPLRPLPQKDSPIYSSGVPEFPHLSMGKCEPETIAVYVFRASNNFGNGTTFHAVPWPVLVNYYHRSPGKLLWSFLYDLSPLKVRRYVKDLEHVPPMPKHDGMESFGEFGGPMFEVTRSCGVSNFLVIGIRYLEKLGYVTIETGADGKPDMIIPTAKLFLFENGYEQKAA